MIFDIKIGSLVPVIVIGELGKKFFLTLIRGTPFDALLPKKIAGKNYKVGDKTLATIYRIDQTNGLKIILSQRLPQFYRKITEHLLSPLLQERRVIVKRAATVRGARFAKVTIKSLTEEDPLRISLPYLKNFKQFTDDTIILVRYSPNIIEYALNSLSPAPLSGVREVIHDKLNKKILVKVDPWDMGSFLGPRGLNVAVSSKLVGIKIEIEEFNKKKIH